MIFPIPYQDVITAFAPFAHEDFSMLLHSGGNSRFARYSFIAVAPEKTIRVDKKMADPFVLLAKELRTCPVQDLPFPGGLVGYFGYELGTYLEPKIPRARQKDTSLPDLYVGVYDTIAVYDHWEKKAAVLTPSSHHWLVDKLSSSPALKPFTRQKVLNLDGQFTAEDYAVLLNKTIDYIYAGDIYQANIARRFQANIPADFDAFDLFRCSNETNPAPFSAYLKFPDFTIVSASPERFLKLENGLVEARPIKGTCKRSPDPFLDDQLKEELVHSTKDQAENLMIVDLLRNDISRVCQPHSVKVPELFTLETYATVHHLTSSVIGQLNPGLTATDLLRATFPGGSITGAPKIRAMEIIAELEPFERGVYCGSIGYLGFDGSMDTNIAIRTFVVTPDRLIFQAGGGIVADSCPNAEYEETTTKAAGLIRCLEI